MKKQKGITLIALVITIIVLLILAGVSISLVIGDNGILEQATGAVTENRKAVAKEEIGMAWTSTYSEYMEEWAKDTSKTKGEYFTEINLNKYLVDTGTVSNLVYNPNGTSTLKYTTVKDNLTYNMEIDALGKVSIVGEGSNAPVTPTPTPTPEPTEATITYNANGGTLAEGTEEAVTVNVGSAIGTLPANPIKSGSTFTGWYTAAEGGSAVTATTVVTGDMTVYAQWTTTVEGVNSESITKDYYGKTVNYTVPDVSNTWEIFYADSENIYLIARNKVTAPNGDNSFCSVISAGTYSTGSSLLTGADTRANYPAAEKWFSGWLNSGYTSSGNNMQATLYMLDSTVWNPTYKVDGVAKYVIGGPTLEMLCASYNAYSGLTGDAALTAAPISATGYPAPSNESVKLWTQGTLASGTVYNRGSNYWLACPGSSDTYSVRYVNSSGAYVNSNDYDNYSNGFRPVVCLESSVTLVESDGATDYTIQ